MAKINFIFKNNTYRKGIGGEMPDDTHVKGSHGFYYVGETEETNLIKLTKFDPMPITEEELLGFNLLNIDKIWINKESNESREFTKDEITAKQKAQKLLKKMELRAKITANVGDIDDIVADISKRLALLERLVMRTFEFLYNSSSISNEIPEYFKNNYGPLLTSYISSIDNGLIKDRVDLENYTELFNKLSIRANNIANLVEEYLNS